MTSYTDNLELLMKDPIKDGDDYFDINLMLNDNWKKIDEALSKDIVERLDGHDFDIEMLQRGLQRLMIEMELDGKIDGGLGFFHDFLNSPKNMSILKDIAFISTPPKKGNTTISFDASSFKGTYKAGTELSLFDGTNYEDVIILEDITKNTKIVKIKTGLKNDYRTGALLTGSSRGLSYKTYTIEGVVS